MILFQKTNKPKKYYIPVCSIILTFFLCSCRNPFMFLPKQKEGSLLISISRNIDTKPASYTITGSGPNGSSFEMTTENTDVEIPDLEPGEWIVTVNALNTEEISIGCGQETAVVYNGKGEPLSIMVDLLVVVKLEWDPNSEPDLAGYKLHYGFSSGTYEVTVDTGNQTTFTLCLEKAKTYYIAATAYNTVGEDSDYSNEIVYNSEG